MNRDFTACGRCLMDTLYLSRKFAWTKLTGGDIEDWASNPTTIWNFTGPSKNKWRLNRRKHRGKKCESMNEHQQEVKTGTTWSVSREMDKTIAWPHKQIRRLACSKSSLTLREDVTKSGPVPVQSDVSHRDRPLAQMLSADHLVWTGTDRLICPKWSSTL